MARTALVVSAHAADFVWRAGGTVALHAAQDVQFTVVCLSYGERGESAKLWRQPDMTLDRAKAQREAEARAAATVLGVHDIQFWDMDDHPLLADRQALLCLAALFRALRPAFVLTHGEQDPYNPDHAVTSHLAQRARTVAQAHGHEPDTPVIGHPPVYLFEPYHPEQCGWKPDTFVDIGPAWPLKRAAIECMTGQEHAWEYYTRVSQQRGAQAARNSALPVAWAEAFQSVFPRVVTAL